GGGLRGAYLAASRQQSRQRFIAVQRTRLPAPKENPAPQILGGPQPFLAIDLDATHTNVESEEDYRQFEEPLPKIPRLKSFLPIVQKRAVGGIQRVQQFAAAALGESLEQTEVGLGGVEFR